MKTIKAISLTIAMLFFSLVSSAYDFYVDGIYYNILSEMDKTVEVTSGRSYINASPSTSAYYRGDVVIPSKVTYESVTYTVTGIGGQAFDDASQVTSIDIPNTVTTIGDYAFLHCAALPAICLPNSVVDIGDGAFYCCRSLSAITIPSSVRAIGTNIFMGCDALNIIVVDENNEVFDSRENCNAIIETSSNKLVLGCPTTVIPSSVTCIGDYAFYVSDGLVSIDIPEGVTSIGHGSFSGCGNMSSITLPNTLDIIGDYAFQGCLSLSQLLIPDEVTSIGENAFDGCSGLSSLIIGDGVKTIGERAFQDCIKLTTVEVPLGVTSIGECAFNGCDILTSLVVSDENSVYDSRENCNAIIETSSNTLLHGCCKSVVPDGVVAIANSAFYDCTGLESIVLPEGVTSIGADAFRSCSSLVSVTLPQTLTTIGETAFDECIKLASISIPENVRNIDTYAFWNCSGLISIDVSEDNEVFDSRNNCNALIETSSNTLVCGCFRTIIPDDVKRIDNYAFSRCYGLVSIAIPSGVESIGSCAFWASRNLSSVTSFGKEAPTIDASAFAAISSEAVLYIPSGSEADYEAKGWYEYFSRVATIGSEEHIADGTLDEYVNESERGPIDIHYTRTLPNLAWNPLYVPFEIPCSALSGKYDVAYINSLHSYDYDDDGTIDNMTVEVVKIPSGTLKANYPYLIRARSDEDRSMHLVLEDATLYRTEENGIDCSSVYNLFEVKGTYSRKSSSELGGSLAISTTGAWQPIPEGSNLGPFRLYLTISSRDDSPLKIEPSALSRVNIDVSGEDDSATGIDGVEQGSASQTNPPKIYDLSGRRVHSPSRGGVYMVNGRKVVL